MALSIYIDAGYKKYYPVMLLLCLSKINQRYFLILVQTVNFMTHINDEINISVCMTLKELLESRLLKTQINIEK